jgi:hypothetical protein
MALINSPARAAGCVLVAVAVMAGCSSHQDGPARSRPGPASSASPVTASSGASVDPYAPSVAKVPDIASDGITKLVSATEVTGSAVYPLPGGVKAGRTLAIAVNCAGAGKITVRVRPTGISFLLQCEKGKVLPTMNEIHLSESHPASSLQFTAGAGVTWSFAAGWDPHPPERQ